MRFDVDDSVVYSGFGVGRVVGLVSKRLVEPDARLYYEVEILGERTTVWIQVEESESRGLRRLTRKEELAKYCAVLSGRPAAVNADRLQRRTDLRTQLKRGTLQDLCEVVRDLSAYGWTRPLGEADSRALRKGREALCQEWAAAKGVPLADATTEINALLLEARTNERA